MKNLNVITGTMLMAIVASCETTDAVQLHCMGYMGTDALKGIIYLHDKTTDEYISVAYKSNLFKMTLAQIAALPIGGTMLLYYADGVYYQVN